MKKKKKYKQELNPEKNRSERVSFEKDFNNIEALASEIAAPLCESEGMELVHVEYQRESQGLTLRVYIDKQGGVTLDDCVFISRQLNDLLDIHLGLSTPFRLEVSSPGPDRPISRKEDFEKFKGKKVKVITREPLNGVKNHKGVLAGLSGEYVNIMNGNQVFNIPCEKIKKARLVDYNGEK